jgi:predicted enzyme related to lactoylglutathione lyase
MPEMDYRMAQTGEGSGAAIYAGENPGHPKYYFDTGDIDASSARVRELGGSADGKTPVPGHGWFAACKDSEGNEFHLWQADSAAAPPA